MSIPTYNLYNFVAQALENQFYIKYFYPWGEKAFHNIIDHTSDNIGGDTYQVVCKRIDRFSTTRDPNDVREPILLCHDQEPLDFNAYNETIMHNINQLPDSLRKRIELKQKTKTIDLNLRWVWPEYNFGKWTLLHSELNSIEVEKYNNTDLFRCAYWWAHAPIAIDWYRFARYDNRLQRQSQDIKANFLIYARETTGKREYRKQFLEYLQNLENIQVGSINKQNVSSAASAEYNPQDFAHTNCSIILETVFDQRVHLTEKTLRPIACGHPFLILNGPGALETIRSYGFKTFDPFINESYDKEQLSNKRMDMVLKEMQRINSLSNEEQTDIWKECNSIAEYNKQLFFNNKFISSVKAELQNNVFV
jgi:hypothetical protein